MPAVKNVGEPCAGEPHARFEVAAGGNQASRASTCRAAQAPLADPTNCLFVKGAVIPAGIRCDSGSSDDRGQLGRGVLALDAAAFMSSEFRPVPTCGDDQLE